MLHLPRIDTPQTAAENRSIKTGLSAYTDAFARYLAERNYAARSIRGYVSCVSHFAHWSNGQHATLADINERLITRFLSEHLSDCHCELQCTHSHHMTRAALRHLLAMIRINAPCPPERSSDADAIAAEINRFDCYLAEVRGLSSSTRLGRGRHVRDFLLDCSSSQLVDPATLEPADIIRFMTHYTAHMTPTSIRTVSVSLRSYFAFCALQTERASALNAALPRVAQWRLAGLPQSLSDAELQQLLAAFDRHTPTGKRDFAITRCLIDLGLRRSEVARLTLGDVDWRHGIVTVRSKNKRHDVLPLPHTTGQAIVHYLQAGRPKTTRQEIFVRHRPPINAAAGPDIIRNAVRYAAQRCGLQDRIRGTDILRHTLAGRLVRNGVKFKEIADLLRHRTLNTTTINAKVDLPHGASSMTSVDCAS